MTDTRTRTLHPACCPKCQGTGRVMDMTGYDMGPCSHAVRVDVTGLDDDTERILALEAEVRRLTAERDAAFNEGVECAASTVLRDSLNAYISASVTTEELVDRIRSLKRGVKPAPK